LFSLSEGRLENYQQLLPADFDIRLPVESPGQAKSTFTGLDLVDAILPIDNTVNFGLIVSFIDEYVYLIFLWVMSVQAIYQAAKFRYTPMETSYYIKVALLTIRNAQATGLMVL